MSSATSTASRSVNVPARHTPTHAYTEGQGENIMPLDEGMNGECIKTKVSY